MKKIIFLRIVIVAILFSCFITANAQNQQVKEIFVGDNIPLEVAFDGNTTQLNKKLLVTFTTTYKGGALYRDGAMLVKSVLPKVQNTELSYPTVQTVTIDNPRLDKGEYDVYVRSYTGDDNQAISDSINNIKGARGKSIGKVTITRKPNDIIMYIDDENKILISENYKYFFKATFVGDKTNESYKILVDIVDSNNKVVFSKDFTPYNPTNKWNGQAIEIYNNFSLPDGLPSGKYRVYTSLQNGSKRLKMLVVGKDAIINDESSNYKYLTNTLFLAKKASDVYTDASVSGNLITINKLDDGLNVVPGNDIVLNIPFNGGPTDHDGSIFVKFFDKNGKIKLTKWIKPTVNTYQWKKDSNNIVKVPISIPKDFGLGQYIVVSGIDKGGSPPERLILNLGKGVIEYNKDGYQIGLINVVDHIIEAPSNLPINQDSEKTSSITINKWVTFYQTSINGIPNIPESTSDRISTINFGIKFEGGPTEGNKRVFVHFVDSSGNIKFLADLSPSVPTSQWAPNSTNWVISDIDIPENIALGDYIVYAGLFDRDTGVKLRSGNGVTEAGFLRYNVGTLRVVSNSSILDFLRKLMTGNIIDAVIDIIRVN